MGRIWEAEQHYKRILLKARTRIRRGGWRGCRIVETLEVEGVDIREAIGRAAEVISDLTITPENAKHWAYHGLIDRPRRRGLGQGKGMAADYPEDTPAQIIAAHLALAVGHTKRRVALARKVVLEGESVEAEFMQGVPYLLTVPAADGVEYCLPLGGFRKPAAMTKQARALADAIRFYAHALALARAGFDAEATICRCFDRIIDIRRGKGENTITYFVSLPGLYLDPRVADDARTRDLLQRMQVKRKAEESVVVVRLGDEWWWGRESV